MYLCLCIKYFCLCDRSFSVSMFVWMNECLLSCFLQQALSQQQQLTLFQNEIDKLRSDNVKLYEKIRFLQSYPTKVSSLVVFVNYLLVSVNRGRICQHFAISMFEKVHVAAPNRCFVSLFFRYHWTIP